MLGYMDEDASGWVTSNILDGLASDQPANSGC